MIFKSLKTFYIHFTKNKLYGAITILGFSFALMFVILLGTYIKKELSVDQFQTNKDRIFRLTAEKYGTFAPPFGPLLMNNVPEIECYTRVYDMSNTASVKPDEKFNFDFLMVDSTFFKMFSFRLIKGNVQNALKDKMSIVLTESYALKLFGKLPEIGEVVRVDNKYNYKVGGIMEDIPDNTHFAKRDALVNFISLADMWDWNDMETDYSNNSFSLYIMEKPHADITTKTDEILKLFKTETWIYREGYFNQLTLEPLTDVYLSPNLSLGNRQGNFNLIRVLSAIVLLILILAILNYINLTIAQSGLRSKEAAVKKVMGIKTYAIIGQYIIESIIVTAGAFLMALLFSISAEPFFNSILDTKINLIHSIKGTFILYSLILIIIVGGISGAIPAFSISNFNLIGVLKGSYNVHNKGAHFKLLITFQYTIIIALLISAIFIKKQTSYLQNFDLGFNQNNILSIENNAIYFNRKNTFKDKLNTIPGVEHVCFVEGSPLDGGNNSSFKYNNKNLSFQTFEVDTSFFRMMNMKVTPTGVAYSDSVILLNETAVKALELQALPTNMTIQDKSFAIYGIVKDFHFNDLKQKIGPAQFRMRKDDGDAWSILVKIAPENKSNTISQIKKAYAEFANGTPCNITFMDEAISKWHSNEERTGKMINYLTFLTIIISVMGLFAMSLFYIQQRTKEIGIRKVNGAKIGEIMLMLNKSFVYWVLFSYFIAAPIAWYAIHKWLEIFAYKINMSWWVFAVGGISALGIALFTVSWQSWKAATINPSEALRNE